MPLPERSISNQTYNGIPIQCAMFYCPVVTRFRIKDACQMNESYYFEAVMRSTTNQTITVICGDQSEDIDITDTFQRYTKFFPDVDVSNDKDAYIVFPIGTYFLYNVQIEVATTPSAWRPAPEDAEDYADQVAQYAVDSQTQKEIFDKLTADGTAQGIYLVNGQLYINGEYIQANTISGNKINGGTISGTEIDIGNGTFTVDGTGEVNASNLHITGGEINIDTTDASPSWQIYLRNTYNNTERTIALTAPGISVYNKNTSTNVTSAVSIQGSLGVTLYKNDGGVKYVAILEDAVGGRLRLFDSNGKERVNLTSGGLVFKDANGNVTKTYPAT